MKSFSEYIDEQFFVISSDNLQFVKSHIYGIAYADNEIFHNMDISKDAPISEYTPGCFIFLSVSESQIEIIQDCCSTLIIYCYQNDDYWAISNSFFVLCDEVTRKYSLTIDDEFYEQFNSFGVTPLPYKKTLAREIEMIPIFSTIAINKVTREMVIGENKCLKEEFTCKVNPCSKMGMKLIDKWISKWASIIKAVYDQGYKIKFDLTGGFDSRLAFSLAVAAGIDFNAKNVSIYSRYQLKSDGEPIEDYTIAKEIADLYGFSLCKDYNCGDGEQINGYDAYEIYHKVLSNIHREPYMPRYYHKQPVFYINGLNGEAVRGWKSYHDGFIPMYKHPIGINTIGGAPHIPIFGWKELLDDWSIMPEFCHNNAAEQDRLFYIAYRGRTHMGTCMYQNMILNYWQTTCFADLDLLKVGVPEEPYIGTAINALILQRIDSRLLDIPVSDNRSFSESEKELARQICRKYKSSVLVSERHIVLRGDGILSEYEADKRNKITPESILFNKFNDEHNKMLYIQHFKDYGRNLYENAEHNVNRKDIAFPLQYASAISAAMEMLNFSEQSNRYSSYNMEKYDIRMLREMIKSHPEISKFREVFEKKIEKYITLRCDVLFTSEREDTELEVFSDDDNAGIQSPAWLNNVGHGYVVQSIAMRERITIKCLGIGDLIVKVRGIDAKDNTGNRNLIEIKINKLTWNNDEIFTAPIMINYEKGYEIRSAVSAKEEVTFDLYIDWNGIL